MAAARRRALAAIERASNATWAPSSDARAGATSRLPDGALVGAADQQTSSPSAEAAAAAEACRSASRAAPLTGAAVLGFMVLGV